jgi:diacylglycerol kinase (ATP)
MEWTALVNPAAGRGRARKLLPRLRAALDAAPASVEVHVSSSLEDAESVARKAADRGRGLVACGGDGTVAALAVVAADCDVPLVVVPVGAGNDFARTIGLKPRRALEALALLADEHAATELRCDLGVVNGQPFTTVANTGFDAEANRWANGVRHLGGTLLYLVAVARTLAVYRPQRFRVTIDAGEPEERTAWLLAIGNGSTYAGGMKIAPDADLDDGLLDLTIIGDGSRAELVRSFPKVFLGTHVKHPKVHTRRGARIVIEACDSGSTMEVYASGERVGPLPAVAEVRRAAVRVRVPRRAT